MDNALTIPRKRTRISTGEAICDRCSRRIPSGDEFTTIRGDNWCQDCRVKWEDWKAVAWVIAAVGFALLLFIASVAR